MKKRSFIVFIVIFMILVTGCNIKKISFKEDPEHNNMDDYTYKFIGESKHFYFQTGKVYYTDTTQALLISNIKIKKNVSKKAKFSIQLYFNDKLLYGSTNSTLSKKELENIVIAESGSVIKIEAQGNQIGESDSFLETKKETFKKSIKLTVKYCVDNNCEEERFAIKYLK